MKLALDVASRSVRQILGTPDDLKFHSCMTLFAHVTPDNAIFLQALDKYFSGGDPQQTLETLTLRVCARENRVPPFRIML